MSFEIAFDQLERTDLKVDSVYKGGAFGALSFSLGDTLAAFVVLYAGLNGIGL